MSRQRWIGLGAVWATYVHFLLWAQFGFLEILQARLGEPSEVQLAMAIMGIAGLGTSFTAAALLGRIPGRRLVGWALAGNALAALAAIPAQGFALLLLAAAIGGSTAVGTVALAAELPSMLPGRGFGLLVGLGTGLAYLTCNLPPVFEASPSAQAVFVAVVCSAASALLLGAQDAGDAPVLPRGAPLGAEWLGAAGLVAATLAFTVLVGLDSAAFAWIQTHPDFQALTWGGGWKKPLQGGVHLLAALAAGYALDRGRLSSLLALAWGLFAVAFTLLGLPAGVPTPSGLAGPLYAVGISLYSVALVVLPATAGGRFPPRLRAAVLFGIAGWLGSALGVGMAQDLGRIPRPVIWGAGLVIGGALVLARSARPNGGRGSRLAVAPVAGFLAFAVPAALVSVATHPQPAPDLPTAIARGRAVYMAEGCIHCHSQYVRPGSPEEAIWGPHVPLDRAEQPVLVGVRRQGPDLTNVGARRNAHWQRLHLEDPRAFAPSSRMPSYRHLFAAGDTRGPDLVAYLGALRHEGSSEREARLAAVPTTFTPEPAAASTMGRALFANHCAACHGADGRGDGRFARELAQPALDLGKGRFWFLPADLDPASEAAALARLIRFGIPGTPMPGHETLDPRELGALVAFVQERARAAQEPG